METQHPSLPEELRGAIDLTDPAQVILKQFVETARRSTALVLIALLADGSLALTFHAPNGGTIQALGLMAAASGMLMKTKESPSE